MGAAITRGLLVYFRYHCVLGRTDTYWPALSFHVLCQLMRLRVCDGCTVFNSCYEIPRGTEAVSNPGNLGACRVGVIVQM